jgi:thiamine-phosphate pyrophosphorylase
MVAFSEIKDMASALARAKLARAARALNARFPRLPPLILMTDENRLKNPFAAARALPKGSAIILRATDAHARAELAARLQRMARERGLYLLIAGDAELAARIGCAGLHLPEAHAREAAHWKALHPSWLITAAAHSAQAARIAAASRCDAIVLAPVFTTQSHMERRDLGVMRLSAIARCSRAAVYALGGINEKTVRRLAGAPLVGIAAIEGLMPHNS